MIQIRCCLPAFPCKSPNKVKKTLGILPDMGEEVCFSFHFHTVKQENFKKCYFQLALGRLNRFCERVNSFYKPGCTILVMSDGRGVFLNYILNKTKQYNLNLFFKKSFC